jgi:ABC-type branched-subunit amino acid transport system permease subunit
MVVLGGLGSILGVALAAIALSAVNNYLIPEVFSDLPRQLGLDFDLGELSMGIYGLVLVTVMLLRPAGLLGRSAVDEPG